MQRSDRPKRKPRRAQADAVISAADVDQPDPTRPEPADDAGGSASTPQATETTDARAPQDQPETQQDSPPEPEENAATFGAEGRAWLVVEIGEDGMQATLTALSFAAEEEIAAQEVADALMQDTRIAHGFDKAAIKEAISAARREPVARGNFVVARGTPATPGADGKPEWKFLPDDQSHPVSYEGLRKAWDLDTAKGVVSAGVTGVLVAPGQLLATVADPTPGTPGKDVLGNVLSQPGNPCELLAGDNVESGADGIVANAFGYVHVADDRITVIPATWVGPEETACYYVHLPHQDNPPAPSEESIRDALKRAGVVAGISDEAITKLCEEPPTGERKIAIKLASAIRAEDGVDAHVDFTFDVTKKSGRVNEDGSIDFRERNAALGIKAGDLIGTFVPATPGRPGQTVRGEQSAARDGADKAFSAGQNVAAKGEGETLKFTAEIDGAVNLKGDEIEVAPILAVSGDVDYETGNIDVPTNVEIGGNVVTAFKVKSGGNVTIGGVAHRHLRRRRRDHRQRHRRRRHPRRRQGRPGTKFIQNSTVHVHGNLTVGAYIINGNVRVSGDIVVEAGGGERGGSIIGGRVIAAGGIRVKHLGSAETDRTEVGIGLNVEQAQRMDELNASIEEAEQRIRTLVDAIGLSGPDLSALKHLLESVSEKRKEEILDPAKELREQMASRNSASKERETLETTLASGLRDSTVVATETVFADTYIEFGQETNRVGDDIAQVEFHYADSIHIRPLRTEEE